MNSYTIRIPNLTDKQVSEIFLKLYWRGYFQSYNYHKIFIAILNPKKSTLIPFNALTIVISSDYPTVIFKFVPGLSHTRLNNEITFEQFDIIIPPALKLTDRLTIFPVKYGY